MDYAVIRSGGKQYRVSPGDTVRLEKLAGEPGATFAFEEVLLASGDGGIQVGKPLISGIRVVGQIVRHERAKKILVFKKKRRKGYQVKKGHRQMYTALKLLGKETALLTFPGQRHFVIDRPQATAWMRAIMAWFDRWLKGEPQGWMAEFAGPADAGPRAVE